MARPCRAHPAGSIAGRSLPGFAQVFHLKMDELPAAEMAGTMQSKQHAFDLIGPDCVIREPRHVQGKLIGMSLNVGDMMLCREPTDIGGGGVLRHCFRACGQGSSSKRNITFRALKIH
jgi:hypothetical protein